MTDQHEHHLAMDDEAEEGVPVEPGQPAADQDEDQNQVQEAPAPRPDLHAVEQPPFNPELEEEVSAIHRKVNRLVARTDEIPSIKNRISVSKPSRATKNFKSDQAPSTRPKSSKTFRRDESLLHVVDQRTIGMKTTLEKTFNGMEQLYERYEALLREFQEQTDRLRELMAPAPPRARSPQPGPSHQQETLSTTTMCVL
ncbi:hypothetical protein COOONC_12487 [Cooperia oncophora]